MAKARISLFNIILTFTYHSKQINAACLFSNHIKENSSKDVQFHISFKSWASFIRNKGSYTLTIRYETAKARKKSVSWKRNRKRGVEIVCTLANFTARQFTFSLFGAGIKHSSSPTHFKQMAQKTF